MSKTLEQIYCVVPTHSKILILATKSGDEYFGFLTKQKISVRHAYPTETQRLFDSAGLLINDQKLLIVEVGAMLAELNADMKTSSDTIKNFFSSNKNLIAKSNP